MYQTKNQGPNSPSLIMSNASNGLSVPEHIVAIWICFPDSTSIASFRGVLFHAFSTMSWNMAGSVESGGWLSSRWNLDPLAEAASLLPTSLFRLSFTTATSGPLEGFGAFGLLWLGFGIGGGGGGGGVGVGVGDGGGGGVVGFERRINLMRFFGGS